MSTTGKFAALLAALLAVLAYRQFHNLTKPVARPTLDETAYWGRSTDAPTSRSETEIFEQEIYYTPEVIDELWRRLNASDWFHFALEGTNDEYGINAHTFESFVEYWRSWYMPKWSERLSLINSVRHFRTRIQGLKIHYVHIKPTNVSGKTVVPLLLLHGWPGSVREFYDIFPLLTQSQPDSDFVFEVIAPSLPGFGWSEGAARTGFGSAENAVVLRNLMLRLGHDHFVIQGGDWGSVIGSHLATLYPENVIGYHSNFCMPRTLLSVVKLLVVSVYPNAFVDAKYVDQMFPLGDKLKLMLLESGSFHIQATKPDTLGAVLTSPIALAAYIQEKFNSVIPHHDIDALLDNIMIYYLTNSFTTGARLYADDSSPAQMALDLWRVPTPVPTGCVRFPKDIGQSTDWQLRDKYPNLVHSTWYSHGGHFAAMEVPEVLHADLVEFVKKLDLTNL